MQGCHFLIPECTGKPRSDGKKGKGKKNKKGGGGQRRTGKRYRRLLGRESVNTGEDLALKQLERGTSTGRDVGERVLLSGLGDEGGSVTATAVMIIMRFLVSRWAPNRGRKRGGQGTHTMTVEPFALAWIVASRSAWDPPEKASNSKTPAGPFQRIVLDSRTVAAKALRDSGPQSRPIQPEGMPVLSEAEPI